MYQRIVERSDSRYRTYMARLLLTMLKDLGRNKRLYWGDFRFLYEDTNDEMFATRECLGLDDKYRLAWDENVKLPLESVIGGATCRGIFLAYHQGHSGAHPPGVNCKINRGSLDGDTIRRIRKWCPDFVDTSDGNSPQFLHRSVREYLSLPDIYKRMSKCASKGLDPVIMRCRLRLAHSRLESVLHSTSNPERDFIRMIGRLGDERRHFVRAILPEFERIQDTKWSWDLVRGDKRDFHDGFWAKSIGDLWCYPSNRGFFDISRSSQAHAWFLLTIARDGPVWYCREHFSQVPSSDRQATGIVIIAGLMFHLFGPAT